MIEVSKMSQGFRSQNISSILRDEQHPIVGFIICLILALFLQLTTIGILLVIAGGVTGFLMKKEVRTIIITFLAGLSAWLLLFLIMYVLNPIASLNAWILLSIMIPFPQITVSVMGGIVTAIGGELGALVARFVYAERPDAISIRERKPTVPKKTTEPPQPVPKRKRVKKKRRKKR
jgi:hypothetical protein